MEKDRKLTEFLEYADRARGLWDKEEYDESRGWTDLAYEKALEIPEEERKEEIFLEKFWKVSMDMALFLWEDDMDAEHAVTALGHASAALYKMTRSTERLEMERSTFTRLSEIRRVTGMREEALSAIRTAIAAAEKIFGETMSTEDAEELSRLTMSEGDMVLEGGDTEKALHLYERSISISEMAGSDRGRKLLSEGERKLAGTLIALGRKHDAVSHMKRAVSLSESLSSTVLDAETLSDMLMTIVSITEDRDEKLTSLRKAEALMEKVTGALPYDAESRSKLENISKKIAEEEESL